MQPVVLELLVRCLHRMALLYLVSLIKKQQE